MSFNLKTPACLIALAGTVAFGAMLSGCATLGTKPAGAPLAPETIVYSVGPCFGFCPVYKVEVTPTGHVTFEGERHTATLGKQEVEGGEKAYKAISNALKAYRPASGQTEQTQCDQRISDMQNYRIVWTATDGTQTVLEHDKGCRSARNEALNKALEALPAELGIANWAKQETRPGVSRG
jgi:type 1 fimbria pilin